MKRNKKVLTFINRVGNLNFVLETMGVDVDDDEVATTGLNGLPEEFDYINTALDTLGEDYLSISLVKSRLPHGEKRQLLR